MPYVKKEKRDKFDELIGQLSDLVHQDMEMNCSGIQGNLNYIITCLLYQSYSKWSDGSSNLGYSDMNNMIGILECAKLELYRRLAAPYEDKKIDENGDVY